ncbi:hypothetical protein [Nostoc sp.]|uniref:hypothetical protein n=1 Tax=Nostoc sp. TaxID=1180 RepID=UPI002FFAFA07
MLDITEIFWDVDDLLQPVGELVATSTTVTIHTHDSVVVAQGCIFIRDHNSIAKALMVRTSTHDKT